MNGPIENIGGENKGGTPGRATAIEQNQYLRFRLGTRISHAIIMLSAEGAQLPNMSEVLDRFLEFLGSADVFCLTGFLGNDDLLRHVGPRLGD